MEWADLNEGIAVENKKHADRIMLSGVKIYPRIGVTAEERVSSQECHVDLKVWGDFKAAAENDSLDQSIDYCQIVTAIQEIALAREYQLIETLAYAIIQQVLISFPVIRTRVKIRKRPAILMDKLEYVEVEVEGTQPGA
jgi:7,8-dihydroneopterin aldolase/epimerase/oxygenase